MGLIDKIFKPAETTTSTPASTPSTPDYSAAAKKAVSAARRWAAEQAPGIKETVDNAVAAGKITIPESYDFSKSLKLATEQQQKKLSESTITSNTASKTNLREGSFNYDRPSDKLSDRARQNGLKAGEDYNNISEDQRNYIRTYYNTLDRDEITQPYLELERMLVDPNVDEKVFNEKYQALLDYIDEEMDAERRANSTASQQYQALKQVKEDVNALGRQYAVNASYNEASKGLSALDESISAIFAGIMSSPDYDVKVDEGRKIASENDRIKNWFREHMSNASESQLNLAYYTLKEEGFNGVKELFNDYLGETLGAVDASKDFIGDLRNNNAGTRFSEMSNAVWDSTLGGWVQSVKQIFSNTESDPTNRKLVGDYTASDAVDYMLRKEIGAIADSEDFAAFGSEGFSRIKIDGAGGDWYNEAMKNATPFEKQFLGYMYISTDRDAAAVQATWEAIKESENDIWSEVKGANTLPNTADVSEGALYRKYANLGGSEAPAWLAKEDGQKMGQVLWDAASSIVGQFPQIAGQTIGLLSAPLTGPAAPVIGRVLGSAAMGAGAYGGAYKEARDSGASKGKSSGYAATNAAMEFLTEYIFGGVGPMGGLLDNKLTTRVIANIADPIAKTFAALGINTLSEGLEEYLGTTLDPVMRNLWLDEENKFELLSDDARYDFFMGAFSGLLLGNPSTELKANLSHEKIGAALNHQGSTKKLIDTVRNSKIEPETTEQKKALDKAKEKAEEMFSGKQKENNMNAGELLEDAVEAGIDTSFLTNPETVSYTKEQITTEDMRAGAVSRLATLGGDPGLAEDVANLASGKNISTEAQEAIDKDPAAQQVVQELQGELNMDEDNALTIAARATTIRNAVEKINAAVTANNPDKVIMTPSQQYLADQGVGVADSQRIGAVIDKVKDGQTITLEEAKLVKMKSPPVMAALLDLLDIDLPENAGPKTVMEALNEKAAEVAQVKSMQAGVQQSIKSAEEVHRRNANGAKSTGVQAEGSAAAEGSAPGQNVGGSGSVVRAGNGTAQTGKSGSVQTVGRSSQNGRNAPVRGPRSLKEFREQYKVIPVNKLTEEQRALQRRLARNGAGSVAYIQGANSFTYYLEEDGVYLIAIRADSKAPFKMEQYADHETGHLWLKALSDTDRKIFLRLVQNAFGEDFNKAFAQVKDFYVKKGLFPADVSDDLVTEELYCFARGAQDFSALPKKKDTVIVFNFAQYHDAVMEIEKLANLEAMALGNMSDPAVKANVESGNFNQTFYERQGYLDEAGTVASAPVSVQEKRASAKQTLDKLAGKKESTPAKTEKTAKSKKSPIPAKSDADELKERYAKKKERENKNFESGKSKKTKEQHEKKLAKLDAELQQQLEELSWFDEPTERKNPDRLAVTPEAIARAEKLSEDVRNDLLSELQGLQTELKSDPAIAENEGYLRRVQAWFQKADAAIREANEEPAKVSVSPAQAEFNALLEELKANPSLEEDESFVERMNAATTRLMAEKEQAMAEKTAKLEAAEARLAAQEAAEASGAQLLENDPEYKELTDKYRKQRASQLRRMNKNPNKSWDSYNAKLRELKDEYDYKVQQIKARLKREHNDIRFSGDVDIEEENNEQILHGGGPGRRSDVSGRGRVQAATGGETDTREETPADGRGTPKDLELARRRCEEVGILPRQFLEESDWTDEQREVAEKLYDAGFAGVVLYTSDPESKVNWVGQSWFENGKPTVAVCVNSNKPAGKIAEHETWHLWLRCLKGDKSHGKHKDFVNFILREAFANKQLELIRLIQRYSEKKDADFRAIETEKGNKLGWSENEIEENIQADIFEEIFCDLVSGQIFTGERLNDILDLIEDSGVLALAQGDYDDPNAQTLIRHKYHDVGYASEHNYDIAKAVLDQLRNFMFYSDSPLFSADVDIDSDYQADTDEDFDAEELMDRTDEMHTGLDEAQAWEINGRGNSLSYLSEDAYNARMDALMAEWEADPDNVEILQRMTDLQNEFDSMKAAKAEDEQPKKTKPKAKKTEKKPVIPPKTEPVKKEAPAPEPAKEQPKTKPIIPPKAVPVKAAAFDVALNEVSGPVNVAGLTLGKAKDRVYHARMNLQKAANPDNAKIQALTAQYEKLQQKIKEGGDDPARFNRVIEGQKEATAKKAESKKPVIPPKSKTKTAPETQTTAELKKPEMRRGESPVDVKGLSKKKAATKVTQERDKYEAWYQQERAKLDKQVDDKTLDDAAYAKAWGKLVEQHNKDIQRYNDQLKRIGAEEVEVKEKATVIKDDTVTYDDKTGEWWKRIKNADSIQIRRLRSDRNTYDVRFTDSKGNTVVYSEVSPSRLEMALGEKQNGKAEAKALLAPAYEASAKSLGEWQTVANEKPAEKTYEKKVKPDRSNDNYGRKIPAKLSKYMEGSVVRDSEGRLLSVYRLGPANGVRNANPNARFTVWSEKPSTMNVLRGLNGAEAYDQVGKKSGDKIEAWLQELADHPGMSEANKNALRAKIAAEERKMREYTTHVTRLDPWREGYTNPKREDVIGNHTLLEGYVNIQNPLEINAKGKDLAWVNDVARKYVGDPANLAGELDVDGQALGDHDGLKVINVTVTPDDKTLGGGQLDRDTVYVTFHHNQGKSTYNTDPTDSELMQYSADPDTETGYAEGTLEDTILKIMHDKDEAHALEYLAMVTSQYLQTGVLPKIDDERTLKIFQRNVTPAEHKYLTEKAEEYIKQFGRLEAGEKPARDVAFPRRTDEGNIRRAFRTAAEAKQTPDRVIDPILREALTNENGVYETITDKAAIAAADRDMRNKGFDQMLAEWEAKAEIGDGVGNKITKYDIAKAQMLYIEAAKTDIETAMKVLVELAETTTTSGQVIQAMRLLKKMPSSYQLYYLKRVVNRLNKQYAKKIDAGKMKEIKIDRDLARAVLKAPDQEALDKAMEALIEDIAKNVPVTFADKWNAWRYLSMLGNPKTHIRNLVGNAIFVPAKFSKDLIAAGLEGMFIKDQSKRHTSLKGLLGGRANAEYRAEAEEDYKGIQKELQDGGKYNPTNEIMKARPIFSNKALEFLRKFNGEKLEQEDGMFLKFHYVNAMTNFLATQGMSVKELRSTPEGRKIMEAARLYAINEAQKATYRDASHAANALNQLKKNAGPMGILVEGVLPFTKTPINILKRGIEYSPIGLLDTVSRGAYKLKNGDISANEFIDGLASGLTGTGIMALGAWLASMGWLRGGGDDDDKQDDFENLQGYQSYSINIGGVNYTIDWMAPVALPLFVGAEIVKQMQKDGEFKLSDLYNSLLVIAEPFTQLSMLSGLNETIQSVKYDEHPLVSILGSNASGYITQAIPTLAAQIARSIPADRRMTYVDKNKDTLPVFQRWWQTNVLGKVPLLNSQRTPYIDAWGRKDTQSSFALRLLENMFSPGYANRIKTTEVDRELQSLADRVGTSVLMTVPDRTISFNNQEHHLTADQYQTYAKTRGDAAMTMLLDLFNSEGYQTGMSDSEKAYAVDAIKDYANVLGKQAVYPDYDPTTDNWAEKCDGDSTRVTNMAMLRAQAHELGVKTNSTAFHTVILNASYLTPVDQAYAIAQTLDLGNDAYVYETGKSSIKYAINSDDKDIIEEHYRQIFPAYYLPVAETDAWRNATIEERTKLLSQVRSDAKADAKAWLATIKAQQGAPLYVKK